MPQAPHHQLVASLRQSLRRAQSLYGNRQFEAAIAAYRRITKHHPHCADAWAGLGKALHLLGRFGESLEASNQAIALDPQHAEAHAALGIVLLMQGQFAKGWAEYEWRLRTSAYAGSRFPLAPLKRDDFETDGKLAKLHVYIEAEQGLGDTLQFARYIPLLAERAAKVSFRVDQPLVSLLSESLPGVTILGDEGKTAPYHRDAALLSLPYLFKTQIESIPAAIPYLAAPADAVLHWQDRLSPLKGLKVGLVWSGNPKHLNDHRRSFGLAAFEPLFALEDVHFVSLQAGARAADVHLLKNTKAPIEDLSAELTDFARTAAALSALDLVITVDTAVAHLAGGLGKAVWLLLPCVNDWRWMLGRADSPWYPSMRIFRQKTGDPIAVLMTQVTEELPKFAKA